VLAVEIAKKVGGVIISADSRQVYRGLDVGTGKVTKKEMAGIPHYLLDIVSPKKVFTVFDFKKRADEVIKRILKREKIPVIVGGTGFYIDAMLEGVSFPEVAPNKKLRQKLEKLPTGKLFEKLKKIDPGRAENIDRNNRPRLIRAIEIVSRLGNVPKIYLKKPPYDVLYIGLLANNQILKEKINKRLVSRVKGGMVAEAKKLHGQGLSWKRMEELGLEYRYLSRYLRGKITKEEMVKLFGREIFRYAKRQKTWFKRNKKIRWFEAFNKDDLKNAITLASGFVHNRI
jgi:tRNA dimethylallyltransferase